MSTGRRPGRPAKPHTLTFDVLLREMEEHSLEPLRDILSRHGEDRHYLRRMLSRKENGGERAERYAKLMEGRPGNPGPSPRVPETLTAAMDEKLSYWLECFAATHQQVRSADMVRERFGGFDYAQVVQRLDEGSTQFDPAFKARFVEAEAHTLALASDVVASALEGEDMKLRLKAATTVLTRRHPLYNGRQPAPRQVTNNTVFVLGESSQRMREALAEAGQGFRMIEASSRVLEAVE